MSPKRKRTRTLWRKEGRISWRLQGQADIAIFSSAKYETEEGYRVFAPRICERWRDPHVGYTIEDSYACTPVIEKQISGVKTKRIIELVQKSPVATSFFERWLSSDYPRASWRCFEIGRTLWVSATRIKHEKRNFHCFAGSSCLTPILLPRRQAKQGAPMFQFTARHGIANITTSIPSSFVNPQSRIMTGKDVKWREISWLTNSCTTYACRQLSRKMLREYLLGTRMS